MCPPERLGGDSPDAALVAGLRFSGSNGFAHFSVGFILGRPAYGVNILRCVFALVYIVCRERAAHANVSLRLCNRIGVIIVPLLLREQEQVFVTLCATIGHRFRHRVRLRPDDVLAQIPPIGLQREGDTPGNAYEVFGFERRMPVARGRALSAIIPSTTRQILAVLVSLSIALAVQLGPLTTVA